MVIHVTDPGSGLQGTVLTLRVAGAGQDCALDLGKLTVSQFELQRSGRLGQPVTARRSHQWDDVLASRLFM